MKAFIFGAGAQGRVVLDILLDQAEHESFAFLDENEQVWGKQVNGVVVLGGLDFAARQEKESFAVIVALGSPAARLAVTERIKARGLRLLNAVHPSAVIASSAILGQGNMIGAGAVISSNARIGDSVIVNTGAIVEHDGVLEDGATICPGANLGGRVRVGRGAFVSTGAIVLPRVSMGAGAVVAAGSIVTRDVPGGTLVMGTPARFREPVDESFDWKRVL